MAGMQAPEPVEIPVIDFQLLSAGTLQQRKDALRQLDDAFQLAGYVYLSNHSIGQDLVEEAFSWSKRFFDLPNDVKALIRHPYDASEQRGWMAPGNIISNVQGVWDEAEIERLRETGPAETREALETGDPYPSMIPNPNFVSNRVLPEELLPGFEAFTKKWWDACVQNGLQLLQCLCEILGIPDRDFLGKQQSPHFNRSATGWNYYASIPSRHLTTGHSTRLNAHTDYGQLTLLFQDMAGGLEIEDEAGIFRPVLPKPGTVILQIGDMLERQSNGRWKSALHRVSTPHHLKSSDAGDNTLVERYSIGFFIQPDFDLVIKPLPGCEAKGRWSSLEWEDEITAGEWQMRRVAVEYPKQSDKPAVQ